MGAQSPLVGPAETNWVTRSGGRGWPETDLRSYPPQAQRPVRKQRSISHTRLADDHEAARLRLRVLVEKLEVVRALDAHARPAVREQRG